jgi:predicted GTPase
MRRLIVMGVGGRDFHDFNVLYRDDPEVQVVAFTATQIPWIAERIYPPSLVGSRYADGIPIRPEEEPSALIDRHQADQVVFAYSDVSYDHVMRRADTVLAAGADFVLNGPDSTALESTKPVVAVCAVRTGSGKSQTAARSAGFCSRPASEWRSFGTRCRTTTWRRWPSSGSRRSRRSTPRTQRSRNARSTRLQCVSG